MANPNRPDNTLPPKGPSSEGYQPADWFWETRKKGTSTINTTVWNILRLSDLPLQWWILKSGIASSLLLRLGATPAPYVTTATVLGLGPYHTVVLGLAVGSSLKQIYWKTFIGDTVMTLPFTFAIASYNTVLNVSNTMLAVWAVTSQQPSDQSSLTAAFISAPWAFKTGLVLYSVGLFTEWWCEIQRKAFKQDPRNKGKPYAGGLFGLSRNINYGGYTLWRTGYSLICGGWVPGVLACTWLAGDFCARAIPSMNAYCEKRYGQQWEEVKRKVPYKLLPWIY